ncbi:MAG: thioredoxin [Bacteroidota bacterium]
MKKLLFIFICLGSLSMFACSSAPGNEKTAGENNDGQVVNLTAASFQKLVWDYKSSPQNWVFSGEQPCIIDFYADWCRPCKMVAPILAELSLEYKGKIRIYKVNTDEQRELAGLFNINSIPAVMFIPKNGKPQMSVGALQKTAYKDMIQNILLPKTETTR